MFPDKSVYPKPSSVFKNCEIGYADLTSKASLRSSNHHLWVYEVPAETQYVTLSFVLWLETYLFFKQGKTGNIPNTGYSQRVPNSHQSFQSKVGKIKDPKKIVVELQGDSTDFLFKAKRDMTLNPVGFLMYGSQTLKSYEARDNWNAYDGVIRIVKTKMEK